VSFFCLLCFETRRFTVGNGLDRSAKPSLWGKVSAKQTDEGLFNTTPFLLKKETGLCLKEKSNPCSLLPQTLSPYQRGQNAPPE
jgi:hypothetical protein